MRSVLVALVAALAVTAVLAEDRPCSALPGTPPAAGASELFAPGWVNQGARTRDIAMSADGREIYFVVMVGGFRYSAILMTRRADDGCWTEPEVLPLARDPRWKYLEPHITQDRQRLFFVTDQPGVGGVEAGSEDIWVAERRGDGWGEPQPLPAPVNTSGAEFFPSVTRDGVLYFTRRDQDTRREVIMRVEPDGQGGWREPAVLPDQVNAAPSQFNAFVDPDERYLIVCMAGHPENLGQVDYWLVPRTDDGAWADAINLGDRVNGAGREGWSPYVSPDGRWFFFMSSRDAGVVPAALSRDALQALHERPGNGLGHTWWTDASFLSALLEVQP